jgi:hypothetical protein
MGCVANQDVKTASKEVSLTLATTRGVEKDFAEALFDEVERTHEQLKRTLVARVTYERIERIANNLEATGDLIGLSKQISDAEQRATAFVNLVDTATPPPEIEKADVTAWVRSLATPSAAPAADPLADIGINPEQIRTLLLVRQLRGNAKGVMDQMDTHLAAIAALHEQVDAWIQTDVTVHGEDAAKAIEAVKSRFPSSTAVQP